jgi:hypothetical protein
VRGLSVSGPAVHDAYSTGKAGGSSEGSKTIS